jgi:outer membrane protein, multidrug efflux system
MGKIIQISILTAGLLFVLVACSALQHFQRETFDTSGLYGTSATTDTASIANKPWQELFPDTHLQQLIQDGLKNNPDLGIAIHKVIEVEAYLSQSKAALLPNLSLGLDGSYTRNPESIYPQGLIDTRSYQIGGAASWEVDLWGKLSSSKRAIIARLLASEAGKKEVQTRLISIIATNYYTLLGLDAKLSITRQTVKNDIELVETIKMLKESGIVTGAAIVQSEAIRYAAEVTIPDLEQQIRETENALSIVLGRNPGSIERGNITDQIEISGLKIGVPASLLDNRPDVMQAGYGIMMAYEITNNARSYFYPALTLTASTGFVASSISHFFDPITFASNIMAGLAQPVFNQKINLTRLKVAKEQQQEALINFKNILLTAGGEVQNALGSYESSVKKIELRKLQIEALLKSVDYTKELLIYGSANYTEVLTAQTSLLSVQLSSINDRLQQLNAAVSLYRAVGGGWK